MCLHRQYKSDCLYNNYVYKTINDNCVYSNTNVNHCSAVAYYLDKKYMLNFIDHQSINYIIDVDTIHVPTSNVSASYVCPDKFETFTASADSLPSNTIDCVPSYQN